MKQKRILIMMAAGYGHLNCTFAFANRLKNEGYKIVYATTPSMAKHIQEQGFETVKCDPYLFTFGSETIFLGKSKLDKFLHKLIDRISNVRTSFTLTAARKMNVAIKKIDPSLILLDSFYPFNYFLFDGYKSKTILLQIMLATKRRHGLPTLNSKLVPSQKTKKFDTVDVNLSWWKNTLKRKWKQLSSLGDSPMQVTSRILKRQNKKLKDQLDFNYAFQPSIKKLEEIILAPKSVDFHEISQANQIYLASSNYVIRKENIKDARLNGVLNLLKNSCQEKVWVYCSLGTLNLNHNKGTIEFFEKLFKVFSLKSNWEIIISTGKLNPKYFGPQKSNIHLFDHVPQLEVLKYCRVMITHGGINSFLECINHLIPMLVYPLNDDWDQNGNAARIEHYGLGLRDDINNTTPKTIIQKLDAIVDSTTFLENLKLIKQKVESENGMDKAIDIVKSMI